MDQTIHTSKYNRIYKIISVLLHPLLIPTYTLILFYTSKVINIDNTEHLNRLAVYSLFTFVIPSCIVFILLKKNRIQSIEMETQKERHIPYIFTLLCYSLLALYLSKTGAPTIVLGAIIATLFIIASISIINVFWKVSAHNSAMGGIVGIFFFLNLEPPINLTILLIVLASLCFIVGYARIKLKAHTLAQVVIGTIMGFTIEYFTLLYLG